MKKGKQVACFILALIFFLLPLTACGSQNAASSASSSASVSATSPAAKESAEKIYVGVIAPLTGNEQSKGKECKQGFELAIEQFNEKGGILGRKIEPVFFDRIDSTEGVVNAAKMAVENKSLSALLIQCSSPQALAIAPIIKEAGIPLIISGNAAAVRDAKNPYIWLVRNVNSVVAGAMVDFAVQKLNCKNPAIFFEALDVFTEYKNNAVKEFAKLGITVPDTRVFSVTDKETNYVPVVAQIEKAQCDVLVVYGSALHLSYLAKAIHDAGLEIPAIVGDSQVSAKECVDNAGNMINGWYCVADFLKDDGRELVKDFIGAFNKKYGTNPNVESAYAYDECLLLKAAIEAAGSSDRKAINDGFVKIKNLDILMGNATYREDHTCLDEIVMAKMQDSVPQFLSRIKYR